jgi:hypothetical protein
MKTLNFNQCKAEVQDLINLGWDFEQADKEFDAVITINEDGRTVFHLESKKAGESWPHDEWTGDDKKTAEDLKELDKEEKLWDKRFD